MYFIKLKIFALLFVFALLFTPGASTQTGSNLRFDRKLSKKEEDWVRKTLRSMTLDEKIGQMIIAEANVVFWNREGAEYRKLRHHIVDNKVGGVILFRSQVWPAAVVTNRWQEMAKTPLLISADLEMGPGMRLDDTPWWAPNMAVAATGDPKWARLQGEATALQARAVGVNWLLAPVADVNNNPDNPVINTRSYGEDPATVAEFVRAFIEGAQAAGAMACAKHFPGHGDTATDSHIGLPVVDVGRGRLERLELVPFRAAIAAGVGWIMSAHIALPQIETDLAAPVRALSEREAAAAEFLSRTEAGTSARDFALHAFAQNHDRLAARGIEVQRIDRHRRVVDGRSRRALHSGPGRRPKRQSRRRRDHKISRHQRRHRRDQRRRGEGRNHRGQDQRLRRKGLAREGRAGLERQTRCRPPRSRQRNVKPEVQRDRAADRRPFDHAGPRRTGRLPLDPKARLLNITFTDEEDPAITKVFVDELSSRAAQVESLLLDHHATESDVWHLLARLDEGKYDAVIFSVAVRARSGKGSVALPPVGKRLSDELIKRKLPLIVISFGNPYLLATMPNAPSYMLAYSPFEVSQRAVAKAVFGEIETGGKLPAAIPRLYPRGHGLSIKPVTLPGR